MRKLLAALAAVVIGATAFTAGTVAEVDAPIDPTVSYGYSDQVPAGVECGTWRYGVVTIHGVRTIDQDGCIDPAAPLADDGFAGLLPELIRDASHN